jgi:uncharacterized protein (DUF362 family)
MRFEDDESVSAMHGSGGGRRMDRRSFLRVGIGGAAAALGGYWLRDRVWSGRQAEVLVGRAESYDRDLDSLLSSGLRELGIGPAEVQGRRILLKPNLVEAHAGAGHVNTHPMLVQAAAETFRRLGAARVVVAEGEGHRRDSLLILDESGVGEVLRADRIPFVDLNYDSVYTVSNRSGRSRLRSLTFPQTLREVDWVVSMPKLKTHHWAGVTLSMKNLFGVMPGLVYGWPKNVLHWAGMHETVYDIHAALRPQLAIVDGIVGMEGDGPIMGTPKSAGVVVMGRNLPAVDATCCRVMGIDPHRIAYLEAAGARYGPVAADRITQLGESVEAVRSDFRLLEGAEAHHGIRLQAAGRAEEPTRV